MANYHLLNNLESFLLIDKINEPYTIVERSVIMSIAFFCKDVKFSSLARSISGKKDLYAISKANLGSIADTSQKYKVEVDIIRLSQKTGSLKDSPYIQRFRYRPIMEKFRLNQFFLTIFCTLFNLEFFS